ncbi:MAG TPA: NUDIX domain-containing protein [Dehalococcoidia bacterium]
MRSHVFVVRDGEILVLQQASGRGWWEQPGGDLEGDEDGAAAAVRETFEETGLQIADPELLRTWSYRNADGDAVQCFAYVAEAPDGDVRLSDEHSTYAWMGVPEYADRYCNERFDEAAPQYASFLAGMRENCALFSEWQRART